MASFALSKSENIFTNERLMFSLLNLLTNQDARELSAGRFPASEQGFPRLVSLWWPWVLWAALDTASNDGTPGYPVKHGSCSQWCVLQATVKSPLGVVTGVTKVQKTNNINQRAGGEVLIYCLTLNKSTHCSFLSLPFPLTFFFVFLISLLPLSVLLLPLLLSPHSLSLHLSPSPPTLPPSSVPRFSLTPFLFGLSIVAFFSPLCCSRTQSLFHRFPPSTLCLAFPLFPLLWCPLHFSPSVLFSSSSLLHHKVDGWMIHLSLCPRTVVILILLHS